VPNTLDGTLPAQRKDNAPYQNAVHGSGDGSLYHTQSLPAWAQSVELNNAYKQYQMLNKQGKYAEAIPFAQTVIALAKQEFGETNQHYASGLGDLAASGIWAVLLNHRTTSHGTSAFFLMAR
jgi:hypothetical protein